MDKDLKATFTEVVQSPKGTSERPTILTVQNAGNWKTLFPTIRSLLPEVTLESVGRHPVIFGTHAAYTLKRLGAKGVEQFREFVRELLAEDDRVFVFDAQSIECLREDPSSAGDLLGPGKSAVLFFREAVDQRLLDYLRARQNALEWQQRSVSLDSLSVVTMSFARKIVDEALEEMRGTLDPAEEAAVEGTIGKELVEPMAMDIEDHLLQGDFGVPRLREFVRRRTICAALKATVPPYSVKSDGDAVAYYNRVLRDKFNRYGLPIGSLSEVSANLAYVLKTNKEISKVSDPTQKARRPGPVRAYFADTAPK